MKYVTFWGICGNMLRSALDEKREERKILFTYQGQVARSSSEIEAFWDCFDFTRFASAVGKARVMVELSAKVHHFQDAPFFIKRAVTVHRCPFTVVRKNLKSVFWQRVTVIAYFLGSLMPKDEEPETTSQILPEKREERLFGER